MTEASANAATGIWKAPQCPFSIEYSLRALDDIRLGVMDAFFSLPRGGAEIGGILLGSWEKGRLRITGYVALECEHAFGPSFALSRKDESRLEQLLSASYPGTRVVGWYHSHTRSEIFLSQADLEIHNRFFPEAWQVALVLRPHTLQPLRLGFFFREAEGVVHSQATYREETLEPLPIRTVIGGDMVNRGAEKAPDRRVPMRPVIDGDMVSRGAEKAPDPRLPMRPVIDGDMVSRGAEKAPDPRLPMRPVIDGDMVSRGAEKAPDQPLRMRPVIDGDMTGRAAETVPNPPQPRVEPSKQPQARDLPLAEASALAAAKQLEFENGGSSGNGRAINEAAVVDATATEAGLGTLEVSEPVTAPTFGMPAEEDRTGISPWVFAFAALIAICWAAFATREVWVPKINAMLGREQQLPPSLGLNLIDREGQLQIHWDSQSKAIANAVGGLLRISGAGPLPQEFPIDKAHLMSGYFTFQRQSERVDVALVIPQPGGSPPAAAITTFIGKMPDKNHAPVEDPAAEKQREALAGQVEQMQKSLKDESELNEQLKKSVDQLKKQLKKETQKRLTNQDK